MKPHHDFAAARALGRALAGHCGELFAATRTRDDKGASARQFSGRLCEALPDPLQALLVGSKCAFSSGDPVTQTAASLMREIARPAANYRVTLPRSGIAMLVSFDCATATALTDRLFGGDGIAPGDVPGVERDPADGTLDRNADRGGQDAANTPLPLSSIMALERMVRAIAICADPGDHSISVGAGSEQDARTPARDPALIPAPTITRDSDAVRLMPFTRGDYCTGWTFTVAQQNTADWTMRIAVLESDIAALAGRGDCSGHRSPEHTDRLAQRATFADIPFETVAVLAEMRLPLARIAGLAAGDILPIAPRRDVPLRIVQDAGQNMGQNMGHDTDSATLGVGTIGVLDDRIALQLTSINQGKDFGP